MRARRVALIGHSGAGKSSCLVRLGLDRESADMDAVLGTQHPPPPLAAALDWLAGGATPPVVAVSNHELLLREMGQAKLTGQHAERFVAIHFVYLSKPKDQLRTHLDLPTAEGRSRDHANKQGTLDNYERFDVLFTHLADQTIDCSGRSVEAVAEELAELCGRE